MTGAPKIDVDASSIIEGRDGFGVDLLVYSDGGAVDVGRSTLPSMSSYSVWTRSGLGLRSCL